MVVLQRLLEESVRTEIPTWHPGAISGSVSINQVFVLTPTDELPPLPLVVLQKLFKDRAILTISSRSRSNE